MDRIASHVVEKAFDYAGASECMLMAAGLLQANKGITVVDIACSRRGSTILCELAEVDLCTEDFRAPFVEALQRLDHSKFGRRVIASFGLTPPVHAHRVLQVAAAAA